MLENYVSPYTATCVSRLVEAGGLPLGKLNMDEFAFGSSTETSAFGPTKNPWDLSRVPGGSSGGSGCLGRCGHGVHDAGFRYRRIDSSACFFLRRRGRQAYVRHGVPLRRGRLRQLARPGGPVHAKRRRRRVCDGGPVRLRSARLHLAAFDADFVDALSQGVEGMKMGIVPGFMNAPGLTAEVKEKVERGRREARGRRRRARRGRASPRRRRHQRVLRAGVLRGILQSGPLRLGSLRLLRRRP